MTRYLGAAGLLDAAAERDRLHAAVARVRELHSPEDRGFGEPVCKGCGTAVTFMYWPCATVRALDGGDADYEEGP